MLRLHVLGPAFGLPSIDAECNAAIALLKARRKDDWTIIPSSDLSPSLPYLSNGTEHIQGFTNIARYISSDHELNGPQRADSAALSSFISTHAQSLLDLSLYVSYDNYTTTRSAFTKILPWHANYMVPPRLRESARSRTRHLNIANIDDIDEHDDLMDRPQGIDTGVGKPKPFEAETQKRASLLLPQRKTVRSMLQQRQGSGVFKLHALAENFLDVLKDVLAGRDYLLGTEAPTALDCLAYGCLSLMLYPQLPQNWLAKTMQTKYQTVARFTRRMHDHLQLSTDADSVIALSETHGTTISQRQSTKRLPWSPPMSVSIFEIAATVVEDLISRTPFYGSKINIIASHYSRTSLWRRHWPTALLAATAAFSAAGYYAFTVGLMAWPRGEEMQIFGRKRLADYGHLGAALAGVSLLGQQAANAQQWHENINESPVRVEVEVDGDGMP